ncbi:lipopolysaccharide core biosynthesis protein LpsA [Helicobacter saguini]|uniref:Lipopolysaccharide core biosynthesis protein LpsA n=2 Tax=Helicobacter saguini TaxID=1548018 RepID=A0A347VTV1_9HELI|nr:lipopolysaccharide core biosynthesis protein LpsA [Helicobacter saguini]MWV67835.1 lipopolysaccharide core biosynthesis protein LpsA [Helicobacter saguini]MWV70697.1 lipopolysaccharide core biosynthesis protein LpsA [Helicobacter saguini]MWV72601.1 lipopolysaccharide core biosynthesis protein LpsA [Helicobacter saguini]TLD94616.1 lipopolysaccharide core biosynthesis protein LpsA [Helicobacter saguini]
MRFFYNLKGIIRHITPRFIPQSLLDSKIKGIFKRFSLESLKPRLEFYNKLNSHFDMIKNANELPQSCNFNERFNDKLPSVPSRLANLKIVKPDFATLGENSLKSGTAYYYDSYEFSRYFSDKLRWCHLFHDVNELVSYPAIVKSRPIFPHNETSVLLKLDKHRHFHFIKDSIKYENKKNILLFRGAVHQGHRLNFFHKHFSNKRCDIGHVGNVADYNKAFLKPAMSIKEQLNYKFLLSLEGFDVGSNLKWILSSNSLCIMPPPQIETWFMESSLRPGVHYGEIALDYSNLDCVLDYYLTRESEAKEIIENAHIFCSQFFNPHLESALNFLVLRKYFYLSNQIDVLPIEQELYES